MLTKEFFIKQALEQMKAQTLQGEWSEIEAMVKAFCGSTKYPADMVNQMYAWAGEYVRERGRLPE